MLFLGGVGCLIGIDIGHQLVAGDGLLGKQILRDLAQQLPVVGQQLLGVLVALVPHKGDFK